MTLSTEAFISLHSLSNLEAPSCKHHSGSSTDTPGYWRCCGIATEHLWELDKHFANVAFSVENYCKMIWRNPWLQSKSDCSRKRKFHRRRSLQRSYSTSLACHTNGNGEILQSTRHTRVLLKHLQALGGEKAVSLEGTQQWDF